MISNRTKARLGVAHVMLNDINSAADQHDALGAMARECNGCPDQRWPSG